jgi:hypothetical protein
VGAATVLSLIERGGMCREIVVVDRTPGRANGVATDLRYATPLSATVEVRAGDYDALTDAALVIITAGVNERAGGATDRSDPKGRLRLLDTNAQVYGEIVPKVVAVAPQAVLMVVTDPPDPLADLTRRLAGHDRVFSTGTLIDSLRFRVHLADRLRVRPRDVQAMVVGEHGERAVLPVAAFITSAPAVGRGLHERQLTAVPSCAAARAITTAAASTGSATSTRNNNAPTNAPAAINPTAATRRPARGLRPPASQESAASPVKVRVSTVVVTSGTARRRTVAFCNPNPAASRPITTYRRAPPPSTGRPTAATPATATNPSSPTSAIMTQRRRTNAGTSAPAGPTRRLASRPPAAAPTRNTTSDTVGASTGNPCAPVAPKANSTTLPVMLAVNTRPSPR